MRLVSIIKAPASSSGVHCSGWSILLRATGRGTASGGRGTAAAPAPFAALRMRPRSQRGLSAVWSAISAVMSFSRATGSRGSACRLFCGAVSYLSPTALCRTRCIPII